ncbi:hypothetical protein [Bacillus velezensis]|uniref:hypothetical protein n=1 Tax=Bacillus velezensis TaxID=492670 RepID=UPI00207A527C|nr:hypothetical protein [Bacillus velezensis]USK16836.1 hypothetical protein LIT36_18950 [Bacillus velezensis]USK20632.1 hypothetical protein LIS75_19240 [Bacillus velezensis]
MYNVNELNSMVETLKLYHRINKDKLLVNGIIDPDIIEKIYVDALPNNALLKKVLLKNTTFLVGKRGTGKSTIVARAQHQIRKEKNDLSVYINAKTVFELSKGTTSLSADIDQILNGRELNQLIILKTFLDEFSKSLKEELQNENNSMFTWLSRKSRDRKIKSIIKKIEQIFTNRASIDVSKRVDKNTKNNIAKATTLGAKTKIGSNGIIYPEIDSQIKKNNERYIETNEVFIKYLDLNNLILKIKEIVDTCRRSGIYVFIDDYSELKVEDRKMFTEYIIQPFYHIAKDCVFLKVAAYPDQIEFGNLESKKYDFISIDMYDIYGKTNITDLEEKATIFTKRLIVNRLSNYTSIQIEDLFDFNSFNSSDECFRYLFYASMCIPRELGIIMDNCLQSHVFHGKKVNKTALIEAAERAYRENIESFYSRKLAATDIDSNEKAELVLQQELITLLITIAQENKKALAGIDNSYFRDLSEVPTSHFRVNKEYEEILAPLEFNNYIYKLGELVGKGSSKGLSNNTETLYSFNFGLCHTKKINYGKPIEKDSKFYQQRALNYSIKVGDLLSESKSISCEDGHTFGIEDLSLIQSLGMKCPTCIKEKGKLVSCKEVRKINFDRPSVLEEVKWTEAEISILTAIYKYEIRGKENITASLLENEIDLTSYSIGKRCQRLAEDNFVLRTHKSPYSYSLTKESRQLLNNAGIVAKADNLI